MDKTIGTCSCCGGRVTVPEPWMAVIPPTPTCQSCGATKEDHGPVIQMTPSSKKYPFEYAVRGDHLMKWLQEHTKS